MSVIIVYTTFTIINVPVIIEHRAIKHVFHLFKISPGILCDEGIRLSKEQDRILVIKIVLNALIQGCYLG